MNQSVTMTPRTQTWQVNGLDIAGLSWGRPGDKPLLALHGWLDNAASFAPLAPCLEGYHVVALDLTGHGQSSHRSPDATYQIWDDLPEIQGVLEQLQWDSFDLVGHSRGAIISAIFAAASPERIKHLVLIDAIMPMAVPESEFPLQLRKGLDDRLVYRDKRSRVFASPEVALKARLNVGLGEEAARTITARNIRPTEGGYCWTTDPRMRSASPVKLSPGQIDAVLSALDMPTLLLLEEAGRHSVPELMDRVHELIPALQVSSFQGGHHFHMEGDLAAVSERILKFLSLEHYRSEA